MPLIVFMYTYFTKTEFTKLFLCDSLQIMLKTTNIYKLYVAIYIKNM